MRAILPLLFAIVATLPIVPIPAEAAALRCGGHIIQGGGRHGPSKYEVLKKCGKPSTQSYLVWIYSRTDASWRLRFDELGILSSVERLR